MSYEKKILVVDDSDTFAMYTCILLKRFGFVPVPAVDGLEALRYLKTDRPALVMLDINMPGLNGVELLKHIKEDEKLSDLPVIMVTVDSKQDMVERCKEIGCADFLTKPLNVDRLHSSLSEHIFSPLGWQRRHIRTPFNRKVRIEYNGASHELYSDALSEGGMYIRKIKPFPVGSEVRVNLTLDEGISLDLGGTVIYTKNLYGDSFRVPPGMAIEFKDVKDGDSAALSGFVSRLVAQDLVDSQEEPVISLDDGV